MWLELLLQVVCHQPDWAETSEAVLGQHVLISLKSVELPHFFLVFWNEAAFT